MIDDYFPRSNYNTWSGAYSAKGKLWVNILEKAYLKLHGGYDFPGSNSSRDLYILTGWLPESFRMEKLKITKDELWKKMLGGSKLNNCLITMGTGPISNEDAVGIVGGHAYGVLEVLEYNGNKLLLVKNPWGHFRWKGKWAYGDSNWTP
jgi:calpain-7